MMNANDLTLRLRDYFNSQIVSLAKTNPMMGLIKPLLSRAVDKNLDKAKKMLSVIADEQGNIDVENILEEMIQSVMDSEPFVYNNSFIGDIEIGGGLIKLNIPLTNKRLIFNKLDIQNFKEVLTA